MDLINHLGDPTFIGLSNPSLSAPVIRIPPVPPLEDQVQIATVPSTAQVELIQSTSPSSFQDVMGDAIHKLRAAALQTTDPGEAAYLSGLADAFQRLEDAGIPPSAPSNSASNPST